MIDDVGELIDVQPGIERVTDSADPDNSVLTSRWRPCWRRASRCGALDEYPGNKRRRDAGAAAAGDRGRSRPARYRRSPPGDASVVRRASEALTSVGTRRRSSRHTASDRACRLRLRASTLAPPPVPATALQSFARISAPYTRPLFKGELGRQTVSHFLPKIGTLGRIVSPP